MSMNTKKEIVKFLEVMIIALQGKREGIEQKIKDLGDKDLLIEYIKTAGHVEGQLYEANYILETITRDRRKKDL